MVRLPAFDVYVELGLDPSAVLRKIADSGGRPGRAGLPPAVLSDGAAGPETSRRAPVTTRFVT